MALPRVSAIVAMYLPFKLFHLLQNAVGISDTHFSEISTQQLCAKQRSNYILFIDFHFHVPSSNFPEVQIHELGS